ncbi:uncharacterized protein V1510DRAFT_424016 [Dipodascopsis tothii]|uniref:uncharacterized protein n=1 Tax=Dipodascopsis tothii TaxID=44089 RepID=UPI0034CFAB90
MPVDIAWTIFSEGVEAVPFWPWIQDHWTWAPWIAGTVLLKKYFSGSKNTWERDMHGRVVLVTGGTAGVGAAVVEDLAARGAQIVLLVRSLSDGWLIDHITDLRQRSNNHLIYAEECDLSSLHSIRLFATKWIDNSPPRRLDMVILCAGVFQPPTQPRQVTDDNIELQWGVNYLANYHLLNILSPALRVQPPDRDVRVIMANCSAYVLADLDLDDVEFHRRSYPQNQPWRAYGSAKLALNMYAKELQAQIDAYSRPDGQPNNVRVFMANPGFVRTASFRRVVTLGSLWGLAVYLLTYAFWWIVLKSPWYGAQTLLHVAMSQDCGLGEGGKSFVECEEVRRE